MTDIPENASAVDATPLAARSPADSYALFAMVFAVVGLVIPILPAAAALMLVTAVEREETAPRTKSMASAAATVAYLGLALQATVCVVLLVAVFFRIIG